MFYLRHLFLWEKLKIVDFPDKKVAWLLAVPISIKEFLFAEKEGSEALETLFENEDIDILYLEINSIL
ncbi:suppressor of fused domain protein [Peribacillus sp. NPDC097264]|uniref:suppressor of fused domain protein n=1 Tax=Peribacillus sp. NPDC097264 TaxID=3390616 RepID=UPI003D008AF5